MYTTTFFHVDNLDSFFRGSNKFDKPHANVVKSVALQIASSTTT